MADHVMFLYASRNDDLLLPAGIARPALGTCQVTDKGRKAAGRFMAAPPQT
jgi:hypothetical protein